PLRVDQAAAAPGADRGARRAARPGRGRRAAPLLPPDAAGPEGGRGGGTASPAAAGPGASHRPPGQARVTRIATRIYAASLYLYPSSFRDEYGPELRRLLADSLRHADGSGEAALVWLRAMAGVLLAAPGEHASLLLQDLRFAFRTLRHAKWFTLTALFTLALGIGANTAIFSVVEALLLRQLPYRDPDRIVMVWVKNPEQGFDHDVTSYPRLEDWRAQSRAVESFAAYIGASRALTGWQDPEQVHGARVTANFFRVMGAEPALG